METISRKAKAGLAMCTGSAFLAGLFAIGLPLSKTAAANIEEDSSVFRFTVEVYLDGQHLQTGERRSKGGTPNTL